MMKRITALLATIVMMASTCITALAEDYRDKADSILVIEGVYYYLDENGKLLNTQTPLPEGYILDESGCMLNNTPAIIPPSDNPGYDYPLMGKLESLGLQNTDKIGWDLNYGGNPSGHQLRSDGKYYYINHGFDGLSLFASALAGEPIHDIHFGELDPISSIASSQLITREQAEEELKVIRDFLASYDWDNASDYDKAMYIGEFVAQAQYGEGGNDTYDNLVGRAGICGSFSGSFHILTRLVGMDSLVVEDMYRGVAHSWNMVKIEDLWYEYDGSQCASFDIPVAFDAHRLQNATRIMSSIFDKDALDALGFQQ